MKGYPRRHRQHQGPACGLLCHLRSRAGRWFSTNLSRGRRICLLVLFALAPCAHAADLELPEGLASSPEEAAAYLRGESRNDQWKLTDKQVDQMIRRVEAGEANDTLAWLLEMFADSLSRGGDHARAERALNAALAARRAVMPKGDPSIGKTLGLLGKHLFVAGELDRAEAVLSDAIAYSEKHGFVSEATVDAMFARADVLLRLGRPGEARGWSELIEQLLEKVAELGKPFDRSYHARLDLLRGDLAYAGGRLATAERRYLAALDRYEQIVGMKPSAGPIQLQGSDELILALTRLARCLTDQDRYDEAEKYLLRALGLGKDHLAGLNPHLIEIISSLGTLQERRGYLDEALETYKEAFQRLNRSHPPYTPAQAPVIQDMARVLAKLGQVDKAAMAQRLVITNARVNVGRESVAYALGLKDLGALYRASGDVELAQALVEAAALLLRRSGATDGIAATSVQLERARVDAASGRKHQSLAGTRELAMSLQREEATDTIAENRELSTAIAFAHLDNLNAPPLPGEEESLAAEALITRQALRRDAGLSRDLMLGAQAGPHPEQSQDLAKWRQTREQLAFTRAAREAALRRPAEKRDTKLESRLRGEQDALRVSEQSLREKVLAALPAENRLLYRDIATARDVQAVLRPDEAMLGWLFDEDKGYLWLLRHDRVRMFALDIGLRELRRQVAQLRRGLDQADAKLRPFDLAAAHSLYRRILAPAMPWLGGARRLHLVPDAPLTGIPLGILVIAPAEKFAGRSAPVRWLAADYDLRLHPSESAFVWAMRRAAPSTARQPIAGFGDPRFEGFQERYRAKFAQLPDTVVELAAAVDILGGDMNAVFTQADASEATLRATALADFRVLYFATHTLLDDEAEKWGIGIEPGILLTPGKDAPAANDGFVSASEIAGLRLDADLVVLSGCNTAGLGGLSGTRGLAGLTRAFYLAGARAVVASHWAVSSRATTQLLGGTFTKMARHSGLEFDQALRLTMIEMASGKYGEAYRHPAFWASFSLYGMPGAPSPGMNPLARPQP